MHDYDIDEMTDYVHKVINEFCEKNRYPEKLFMEQLSEDIRYNNWRFKVKSRDYYIGPNFKLTIADNKVTLTNYHTRHSYTFEDADADQIRDAFVILRLANLEAGDEKLG